MRDKQLDLFPHKKKDQEGKMINGKQPEPEEFEEYKEVAAKEAGGQLGMPFLSREESLKRVRGLLKHLDEKEDNNKK